MRLGLNKIQLLVALNFPSEDIADSVFIFCSTKQKQIKIFYQNNVYVKVLAFFHNF